MSEPSPQQPKDVAKSRKPLIAWVLAGVLAGAVTYAISSLLVSIFWHKVEATNPYVRLVEVTEDTIDPTVWAKNWPRQYDTYRRTVDSVRTRFGGSEAMPAQKLEKDPWLKRMFAGYPFSIDFREARGHAYMLFDQEHTDRVLKRPQTGACLHCHSSVMPLYRTLGQGDVQKGFEAAGKLPYADANKALYEASGGTAHPVACVDCHDPKTMAVRVTRPGLINGIRALAESDEPVPHLVSVERWRAGARKQPYDPNVDATRQEMRSLTCAQCHVEYYCGPKTTLFFPWNIGMKAEQIETYYDQLKFPDGTPFADWKHAETGAPVYKAQHPEFELWSQGIHARSGVACADCHMPYMRDGATKITDHHVRSPLLNANRACLPCHNQSEKDLIATVETIQQRTRDLMDRAAAALMAQLDAIAAAKKAGCSDEELKETLDLQRKGQWRLDFINAENSMGFHAPQEAARILGEAADYARQGQVAAMLATQKKLGVGVASN